MSHKSNQAENVESVLNQARIDSLLSLGSNVIIAYFQKFVEDSQNMSKRMEEVVILGDFKLIAEQAHCIKGAAANLGGDRVVEVAKKIEVAAKAQDASTNSTLVDELNGALSVLTQEIVKLIESLKDNK